MTDSFGEKNGIAGEGRGCRCRAQAPPSRMESSEQNDLALQERDRGSALFHR
jgi:hypothetical protein